MDVGGNCCSVLPVRAITDTAPGATDQGGKEGKRHRERWPHAGQWQTGTAGRTGRRRRRGAQWGPSRTIVRTEKHSGFDAYATSDANWQPCSGKLHDKALTLILIFLIWFTMIGIEFMFKNIVYKGNQIDNLNLPGN